MNAKKTKIIATIGPACEKKETIKKMIDAGMNIARLNFSHGDYPSHLAKINTLKELIDEGNNIAIMLDTKGPEIRCGLFEQGKVSINKGDEVEILMEEVLGSAKRFSVSYSGLINDVKEDSIIKFDDGKLIFRVTKKDSEKGIIYAVAKNSHVLSNRKSCVVPYSTPSMPYLSKKDIEDIKFGCENDVDYIAASFTRYAQDIIDIKNLLKELNHSEIRVIAKIESQDGLDNFDSIIQVADGAMVARGDLGVEIEPEEVPIAQDMIVSKCRAYGKPVIIATHMLESMQHSLSPTRAEVNDVAIAINQSADAIMLSGETANGSYPLESVEMEARIAARIEPYADHSDNAMRAFSNSSRNDYDAIAYSVASSAIITNASLIIAFSSSGATSRRIAKYRPKCPVISVSASKKVARLLALDYGVIGVSKTVENRMDNKETIKIANELAKEYGVAVGSSVLITGGNGKGSTNYMEIIKVK